MIGSGDESAALQGTIWSGYTIPAGTYQGQALTAAGQNVIGAPGASTLKLPPTAAEVKLLTAGGTSEIAHLVFDGNRDNRAWPGGHSWEHSALLYLSNGTFDVHDLTVENSTGDGIHIVENATATLTNITAADCFRGGVTITGGNTTVTIDNLQGSWLQIERDTDGAGGSTALAFTMTNSTTPLGVELEAWGAVAISDCDLGARFWLVGSPGGAVRITDCNIGLSIDADDFQSDANPEQVDTFGRSIYWGRDVVFTRCTFHGAPLRLYPSVLDASYGGQSVTFVDCTFTGSGAQAVYNYGDLTDLGNTVEFVRCTYTGFDAGYELRPGFYASLVGTLAAA